MTPEPERNPDGSYRVPGNCPSCGQANGGMRASRGEFKPEPGYLALCVACGQLLIIGEDFCPREFRSPDELMQALSLLPLDTLKEIMRSQRLILYRRASRN
ncbi:MAG: hypothetical protein NVS1B6_20010 [Steroidobacteraceae bacterium]